MRKYTSEPFTGGLASFFGLAFLLLFQQWKKKSQRQILKYLVYRVLIRTKTNLYAKKSVPPPQTYKKKTKRRKKEKSNYLSISNDKIIAIAKKC